MTENYDYLKDTEEYFAERENKRFVKTPLIIALAGLILSVFYGVGGIISVVSLILSVSRAKKRKSDALKWAIVISAVTIAISVLYAAAICVAVVYGANELAPPVSV